MKTVRIIWKLPNTLQHNIEGSCISLKQQQKLQDFLKSFFFSFRCWIGPARFPLDWLLWKAWVESQAGQVSMASVCLAKWPPLAPNFMPAVPTTEHCPSRRQRCPIHHVRSGKSRNLKQINPPLIVWRLPTTPLLAYCSVLAMDCWPVRWTDWRMSWRSETKRKGIQLPWWSFLPSHFAGTASGGLIPRYHRGNFILGTNLTRDYRLI